MHSWICLKWNFTKKTEPDHNEINVHGCYMNYHKKLICLTFTTKGCWKHVKCQLFSLLQAFLACLLVASKSDSSLLRTVELEYPDDGHVESHEATTHNWITIVFRGRELEPAAIWIILFCRDLSTQVTIALCCQVGSFWKGKFSLGYDHGFPG